MKKKIRVFINGFGRIGRCAGRIILDDDRFELVGVNDLYSFEQMRYLFKYDSIYGSLDQNVALSENNLVMKNSTVSLYNKSNPEEIALYDLDVDVLLECSGAFLTEEQNRAFLKNGAKKVVISTPPKDEMKVFIYGINHKEYSNEKIISNSSCSANAIVPIFKIINDNFGIKRATMSMYHSYTSYQRLLDSKHYSSDIRRTRSAPLNIIPLLSSASEATAYFFPHLRGKLSAKSIRIPLSETTLYHLFVHLDKKTDKKELEKIFLKEIESKYKQILDTTNLQNTSKFYLKSPFSATIDLNFLTVVEKDFLRVSAWQDNEYGYVKRLLDMAYEVGSTP